MSAFFFLYMTHSILKKHIAFITAHPDDETFLAAGTIYKNNSEGGINSLFCATLGEKGTSYILDEHAGDIKNMREKELSAVAKFLGITNIEIGNFTDGDMKNYLVEMYKVVRAFIFRTKPEVLISFGDDGFTGHSDHIAIGMVVKKIAQELHISFVTFAKPPSDLFPDFDSHLLKKRKNGTYISMQSIAENNMIAIVVDPNVKLQALALHESQFAGLNPYNNFSKPISDHILQNEYFRVNVFE